MTFRRSADTLLLSPPDVEEPQVTTVPSSLRAAKALFEADMRMTPELSCSETELLSAPLRGFPQVMTDPSLVKAANAPYED